MNGLLFPITLTLQAALTSLVLFAVIGVPLALYTARSKTRVSRAVLFLATLPLIFPPVALGYLLLLLLLGINGPVGALLHEVFGARLVFSQTAVTLAAFIAGLPLVIRPVKEAFESKTLLDLECAARVCGATPMTTFLRVTLPTVRNAVLSAFLLGTARTSGEVGITMMLGGNVSDKTNTLSLEIYNAVGRGDFDTATALCAVLAAVALVLYAALELLRRRSDV
mgnify:CR=1 FL=1